MQEIRDTGLIPGLGGSLGVGNGSPLQYSRLGNPLDRGAWWLPKSRTRLSDCIRSTHPSGERPQPFCWLGKPGETAELRAGLCVPRGDRARGSRQRLFSRKGGPWSDSVPGFKVKSGSNALQLSLPKSTFPKPFFPPDLSCLWFWIVRFGFLVFLWFIFFILLLSDAKLMNFESKSSLSELIQWA